MYWVCALPCCVFTPRFILGADVFSHRFLQKDSITVHQVKLIFAAGLVVGVLSFLAKVIFLVSSAQATITERNHIVLSLLEEPAIHALELRSPSLAHSVVSSALNLPSARHAILLDVDGKALAVVSRNHEDTPFWKSYLAETLMGADNVVRYPMLLAPRNEKDPGQPVGALLVTFDAVKSFDTLISLMQVSLLVMAVAGIAVVVVMGVVLDRFISRPIVEFTQQIEAVNAEDPHGSLIVVPAGHGRTEIGLAVQKVNAMLIHMGNVQRAMRHMTTRDVATNLPNRMMTTEYLSSVARRSSTGKISVVFAVLMDRLDEMKDVIGHEKIDELAIEMAGNLMEAIGNDAFVGRIGVDLFAVVLEDQETIKSVIAFADRLLADLSKVPLSSELQSRPSICIGIALCPNDGLEASGLLRKAIAATVGARRKTHNRWDFFEEAMADDARHRLLIEDKLHKALENKEFTLYFQPQFSGAGDVVGVEALIRWFDDGVMVSPGDFIPIAEDCGLIVEIGDYVLEETCRVAALLRDRGYAAPVAVNVSPMQLQSPDFVKRVQSLIADYSLPPSALEMEITEYALAQEGDAITDRVRELRSFGVRIAIDDFGTGYSSLSYLRRFPVDVLKIDRSFICDVPDDVSVPLTILTLAHRMGMTCVAEGIETEEQRSWLVENDCGVMQGFLLARPMPLEQFLEEYAPDGRANNVVHFSVANT